MRIFLVWNKPRIPSQEWGAILQTEMLDRSPFTQIRLIQEERYLFSDPLVFQTLLTK